MHSSSTSRRAVAAAASGVLIATAVAATTPAQAASDLSLTSVKLNGGECGGYSPYVFRCHGIGITFTDRSPNDSHEYVTVAVSPGGKKLEGSAWVVGKGGGGSVSFGLKTGVEYRVHVEERAGNRVVASSASRRIVNRVAKAPLIQSLNIRQDTAGNYVVRPGEAIKVRSTGAWEKGLKHVAQVADAESEDSHAVGKAKKVSRPVTSYTVPKSAKPGEYVWFSTLGESTKANARGFGFGPLKVVAPDEALMPETRKADVAAYGKKKGTAKVGKVVRVSGAKAKTPTTKISYQWFGENGKIKGATKATYKVSAKHKGQRVAVLVRFTKKGHSSTSKGFVFPAAQ